ncbi:MAG: hypothetical protein AB1696_27595 [Planctomycetota bacterium]
MPALLHNEDCTEFFATQPPIPDGKAGELIDSYVDQIADAGTTVLLCNTNSRRTNYRSNVWEAHWDGYDPDGPDDQPFLASLPAEAVERWRRMIGNMLEVYRQREDYPARVIQRCRYHGIAPWISLRMNDVHNNKDLSHPSHSRIYREGRFFFQGRSGYFARGLDYARWEVRDHYKALIVETLERYDIDGLELDFMREPYLFSVGKEEEGRAILTAWLRDIRQLTNTAAARRGHSVRLGVRVPSRPETALALGLDAIGWAKTGLIDLLVVTPRWATLEFDMPIKLWREQLGQANVTLAGGLEILYRSSPGARATDASPELATGAAVAVLVDGADCVYLFNYFHPGGPWLNTRRAMRSLDELLKLPRRVAVTYRDITAPGESYKPPLPATGRDVAFNLPLGPKPGAGWTADATIGLADTEQGAPAPALAVNGTACELRKTESGGNGECLLTYAIPLAALPGANDDTIAVKAAGSGPLKVTRVEVRLAPLSGQRTKGR